MKYLSKQVTLQEVPNEVSLSFLITGCKLKCKGCHSASSWDSLIGNELTQELLEEELNRYKGMITCVLFLGGEWEPNNLSLLLLQVQNKGLKTCLYTGLEEHEVPSSIIRYLDYIKVGPYIAERGGLNNPNTNQRFLNYNNGGEDLTHLFQ